MNEIELLLQRGPAAGQDADGAARAAARRFSERVAAQGRADVAYATIDSPLGPLLLAGTPRGSAYRRLPGPAAASRRCSDAWPRALSPRIVHAPGALDVARRELDEYFAARRRRVRPRAGLAAGRTVSPARAGGDGAHPLRQRQRLRHDRRPRRAARAARARRATRSGRTRSPIVVPCHRVLRHGGELGGYAGGPDRKRALLALEGAIA